MSTNMKYTDIIDADALSTFLLDLMPENVLWLLYRHIRDTRPDLLGDGLERMDPDPVGALREQLVYVLHTAVFNLGENMVKQGVMGQGDFERKFL